MKIPEIPAFLLDKLSRAGYDAYVVGGCVRDTLLETQPEDWDICTSARPDQVKQVFDGFQTIDIGAKHGTVAVVVSGCPYEITTFRTESGYRDGRHPEQVAFVNAVAEDLLRRDFTINAMAYNHRAGLVDLCSGQADLKRRLLCTVGEPDQRFAEDALRIMRCLRFASVLDFHIHSATAQSAEKNRLLLKQISAERICSEFSKLLCGKAADRVLARHSSVLAVFLPELEQVPEQDYRQMLRLLQQTPSLLPMRLAVFFHIFPDAIQIPLLQRMKFSNETIGGTRSFLRFTWELPADDAELKMMLFHMGIADFEKMLMLKNILGQKVDAAWDLVRSVQFHNECVSVRQLALNGADLEELGYCGKQIGETLHWLVEMVIRKKTVNTKEALTNILNSKNKQEL